jgi:diaminopropionate ammonia-lyase
MSSTCFFALNRFRKPAPLWDKPALALFGEDIGWDFHRSLAGYRPTPLFPLPALAARLGVKKIWAKDESYRFGLNAFKVLGASYAIYRFLKQAWEREQRTPFDIGEMIDNERHPWANRYTFCTATDGNHGRAVAWTARKLHQQAVIYMPRGTVRARAENIRSLDARVEIIDGSYDDAVKTIAADAAKNGWQVIADTAYPGYMTIPGWIMAGYITMFREMEPLIHGHDTAAVDIILLPAGVGSFAAAAGWYYTRKYGTARPVLVSVEPTSAACLLASAASPGGKLTTAAGPGDTIMAGLNCGTPSSLAWPIVKDTFDLFVAITDDYAIEAMRTYYYPAGDDPHIISGESGASGLGALMALLRDQHLQEAKDKIGLGPDSRVLLFNTEGATDPDHFAQVVGQRTEP